MYSHIVEDFWTCRGAFYDEIVVSYEIFGRDLNEAPVVVVIHALTGNSDVCSSPKGWWKGLIGENKCIDLSQYSVVSLNIPGNGYDGRFFDRHQDFTAKDIAILFNKTILSLGVHKLHAIIGGSLGGSLIWEWIREYPNVADTAIPVACDWRVSDWLAALCNIQRDVLLNSKRPLHDARKMAMMFYRSPESLEFKFNQGLENDGQRSVNSWLNHHGQKLTQRFDLRAYLMMNHLLSTINEERSPFWHNEKGFIGLKVVQISIQSDLMFPTSNALATKKLLDSKGIENDFYTIQSIHGHDAFLIELDQLETMLKSYF